MTYDQFINKLVIGKRIVPRSKKKNMTKEKSRKPSQVNVTKSDGNESDSFAFSLSITPSICYADDSKWLLDTGTTYRIL